MNNTLTFEVDKKQWNQTRLVEEPLSQELKQDEVLLKVDRFALTANNISYCMAGDLLDYWGFFPTEEGWGRIPVMGYGEVVASAHDDIPVGERVWGFFPMSTHLKIQAGKVSPFSFKDISPHRAKHAPVYKNFDRVNNNPSYRKDYENWDLLLKGLFTTSWLVEDFMQDNGYFAADQFLITSASSKTSIALAYAVKQRGEKSCIGVTSEKNRPFVDALGLYDQVVTYEELDQLDPSVGSIIVDMSGYTRILEKLHRHFGEQIKYSCLVGMTHHKDSDVLPENLPGAKPNFFFAPAQIEKRNSEWGDGEVLKRMAKDMAGFYGFMSNHMEVIHHGGAQALEKLYQSVYEGIADPREGHVVSMA